MTDVAVTAGPDIAVERHGHVALTEIRRPPSNYFDLDLLERLADCWEELDRDTGCRAIVLASEGKAFCAGNQHLASAAPPPPGRTVYRAASRLFHVRKPVVAAIHGAAVGGGMGLALVADFRIVCRAARFWPNFSRLGMHAGFGLTVTLPRLVGVQMAANLLYTGRRIDGEEAVRIGLADELVPSDELRERALALATDIAESAPFAVQSMRTTLRRELCASVDAAMEREFTEQSWQRATEDFAEGTRSVAERRAPVFRQR
jgi:enoyl-CoA hydratase/carnithine racemase